MSTVLILGCTGMLGNAVTQFFLSETDHKIKLTTRNWDLAQEHFPGECIFEFNAEKDGLNMEIMRGVDYVINCIGVIKPFINDSRSKSIRVNSLFPSTSLIIQSPAILKLILVNLP